MPEEESTQNEASAAPPDDNGITDSQRAAREVDAAYDAYGPGNSEAEGQLFTALTKLAEIVVRARLDRTDEDLVQEIVIKAFHHLGQFRGESRISTWFNSIARNECNRELSRVISGRNREISFTSLKDDTASDDHKFRERDAACDIQTRMGRLPKQQLRVVELKLEGYTLEEIAALTGAPLGTTRSRWRLAKEKMGEGAPDICAERQQAEGFAQSDINADESGLIHQEVPQDPLPPTAVSAETEAGLGSFELTFQEQVGIEVEQAGDTRGD